MNVRTAVVAVAMAGALVSGCLGGGGGQTLEEAKVSGARLGTYLAPVAVDADSLAAEAETLEQHRSALAEVFGPAVARAPQENGSVIFDSAFRFDPAAELFMATTVDGRPTLITWSLTGGAAFFYEPTVVDVVTGAIYQGSVMGADPEDVAFFGPLFPPADARIIGTFTVEEIYELEGILRSSFAQGDAS